MKRAFAIGLLLASALPARADYISDQIEACAAPLAPDSRAAIIAACDRVLQMGELPISIQSPAYVSLGNAYAAAADFTKALLQFGYAIDVDPNNPAPLTARGMVLLKQRKFQDAFDDFNKAADLPGLTGPDAMALYGRGLAAVKLGKPDNGDMAKAVALDPTIAQYYADNGLAP